MEPPICVMGCGRIRVPRAALIGFPQPVTSGRWGPCIALSKVETPFGDFSGFGRGSNKLACHLCAAICHCLCLCPCLCVCCYLSLSLTEESLVWVFACVCSKSFCLCLCLCVDCVLSGRRQWQWEIMRARLGRKLDTAQYLFIVFPRCPSLGWWLFSSVCFSR